MLCPGEGLDVEQTPNYEPQLHYEGTARIEALAVDCKVYVFVQVVADILSGDGDSYTGGS